MEPFSAIDFLRREEYCRLMAACEQISSDYSFTNLWAWAEEYGLSWSFADGLAWIRQSRPYPAMWAPIGPWAGRDWGRLLASRVELPAFIRIPERLQMLWRDSVPGLRFEEARDDWDYLYAREELVALKGNRFHKKKNLYSQFVKSHDFTYRELGPELLGQVLAMQGEWCSWRDCVTSLSLAAESRVIERTLTAWPRLAGIMGGALLIGETLVAFTVGERLDAETLVIHFEKGLDRYKGVYQAINRLFLENHPGYQYVNREQDLGDLGLRHAKLSYQPNSFLKKYKVSRG